MIIIYAQSTCATHLLHREVRAITPMPLAPRITLVWSLALVTQLQAALSLRKLVLETKIIALMPLVMW